MSDWKCPKCGNEEWADSYTLSYCGNCGSVIREGDPAGPDSKSEKGITGGVGMSGERSSCPVCNDWFDWVLDGRYALYYCPKCKKWFIENGEGIQELDLKEKAERWDKMTALKELRKHEAGPDTSVAGGDQGLREKAPATFEDAIDAIWAEMRAVMIERQKKYGPNNVQRLGIIGVLDRAMHDKMERLRRYYNREDLRARCYEAGVPQEVIDRYLPALNGDYDDEALEDAHIDAANYVGIIALMLRRGWWGLPIKGEAKGSVRL